MFQAVLRFREKTRDFASRPEFALAIRITLPVLLALLAVAAAFSALAVFSDRSRVEQYFVRRITALNGRNSEFARILASMPQEDMERFFQNRRSLPPNLRNFALVFPDGEVTVVGPLESAEFSAQDFSGTDAKIAMRKIGKEEFVIFPIRLPSGRILVLYEPKEALVGPKDSLISGLLFGILAFSMALFAICLHIARDVIRPIEALAERERAYARHIAHELKTPLAVAKSDLQLSRMLDSEEAGAHIESAISEISVMRDTVDDLLLFSASGSLPKKQSVDPLAILSERIASAKAQGRFDVSADSDAPERIPADPRLLGTLFRNLVSNALVHAPENARVSIRFGSDGFVFSNPAPDADPKIVSRAFEAFVGTPGKGSGIGLSLVKRIAEAHGWKAYMELVDGTFRIGAKYRGA